MIMENATLKIQSLNISEKKGTIKKPCESIVLNMQGIEGDAHAGNWHRQISILAEESIRKFEEQQGRKVGYGEFAENITTIGFPIHQAHFLDRLVGSDVEIEITQIGKKCHGKKCAISVETGDCIMPIEGVFGRVIKGGKLKVGDTLTYQPKVFKVKVITLSDRAYQGVYDDLSGAKLVSLSKDWFAKHNLKCEVEKIILPDEKALLEKELNKSFEQDFDIIYTTGSTGIGPRDIAPDVIMQLLDKEIPGVMDLIRLKYGKENSNALISRSVAGVKNKTLVFAIPGSVKAITEYMEEINRILLHSIYMLHGIDKH